MDRILLLVDEISTWIVRPRLVHRHSHLHHQLRSLHALPVPGADRVGVRCQLHPLWHAVHAAGAYTLARNGHVRADFIYRSWSPHPGQWIGSLLLFFFPGMLAFVYAGYGYAKCLG